MSNGAKALASTTAATEWVNNRVVYREVTGRVF
jgi:hypothetical protein